MASSSLVRIAVVGDIHGFWDLDEDQKALRLLQPHLVLFTGNFSVTVGELISFRIYLLFFILPTMILIKFRKFQFNSKLCQVILVRKMSHLCRVLPLFLSLKQLYWAITMPGSPMTSQGDKTVFKFNSISLVTST